MLQSPGASFIANDHNSFADLFKQVRELPTG